jgi:hypothetical protein
VQKTFYIILILLDSALAFGQSNQDTTFLKVAVLNAENTYHDAMKRQLNIYNGRAYKNDAPTAGQHPYFLTDDWVSGAIIYESDYYTEFPLLFDISSEKVITENPVNGAMMELVSSKINTFEIEQHTFVRLLKDSTFSSEMSDGFYEQLYNGHLKLYAQRKKKLQKRIKGNVMLTEFDEKNKYFLFNGNHFVRVTGKSSVIKALGGKKKLPKLTGTGVGPKTNNKVEDKLIYLTKFYDSHISAL